jgi:cell division protein FtsW
MAQVFKYLKGDRTIWIVMMFFALISILVVFTSVGPLALRKDGSSTGINLARHFIFLVFGFGVMFLTHRMPYNYFSKISVILLWVSIGLLVLTLGLDMATNGAKRWLKLPFGFTIQTSDLAKIAIVMYVARVLSKYQEKKADFKKVIVPLFARVMLVCALIFTENLSTAVLIFGTVFTLMLVGRVKWYYLMGILLTVIIPAVLFIIILTETDLIPRKGTWIARWERFIGTSEDGNYAQANLAKNAIVTGGIFGKGPGHSEARYALPHAYSDFIYAIIIEEYGLIGGLIVVLLYLILLFRAGVIVKRSPTHFGALLAFGLAIGLVFQAFINMGVCVGLMPVTGQTLPFISWGGTSILFTSIAVGAILSVSRNEKIVEANEQTA